MRELKIIIIISIIACLAAPVLLYFGFNYYRDKKFSYIHKPMDRLWKLKQIIDRGISQNNKAILDSACIEGLSTEILDAIYKQKEFPHPRMVEYESGYGGWQADSSSRKWHVFYLLEDKKNDTVYTLQMTLYPSLNKEVSEWKIASFETELWRKEAVIARFYNETTKRYPEETGGIEEANQAVKQFQKGIAEKNVSILDSVCVKGMSEKILKDIYEKKGIIEPQITEMSTQYCGDEGRDYQYRADFLLKDARNDTATFRVDLYLKEVSSRFKIEMFELWRRIEKS